MTKHSILKPQRQNSSLNIALFLSKDVVFKPSMLETILQLNTAAKISVSFECTTPPKKTIGNKRLSPATQWGYIGVLSIASQILWKKFAHFVCNRININHSFSLKGIARKHNIPYLYSEDINSDETLSFCIGQNANVAISFQHQKIKNSTVLSFDHGFFNIHPSKLPKYRGVKPIHWAALSDDKHFSVSLHTVGPEYDTGEIWLKKTLPLNKSFSMYNHYHSSHLAAALIVVDFAQNYDFLKNTNKETSSSSEKYYKALEKEHYAALKKKGWKMF